MLRTFADGHKKRQADFTPSSNRHQPRGEIPWSRIRWRGSLRTKVLIAERWSINALLLLGLASLVLFAVAWRGLRATSWRASWRVLASTEDNACLAAWRFEESSIVGCIE